MKIVLSVYGLLGAAVYRQCAVAYTDLWAAYALVIPAKRHRPVGKETGHTAYIERLNWEHLTNAMSISTYWWHMRE